MHREVHSWGHSAALGIIYSCDCTSADSKISLAGYLADLEKPVAWHHCWFQACLVCLVELSMVVDGWWQWEGGFKIKAIINPSPPPQHTHTGTHTPIFYPPTAPPPTPLHISRNMTITFFCSYGNSTLESLWGGSSVRVCVFTIMPECLCKGLRCWGIVLIPSATSPINSFDVLNEIVFFWLL